MNVECLVSTHFTRLVCLLLLYDHSMVCSRGFVHTLVLLMSSNAWKTCWKCLVVLWPDRSKGYEQAMCLMISHDKSWHVLNNSHCFDEILLCDDVVVSFVCVSTIRFGCLIVSRPCFIWSFGLCESLRLQLKWIAQKLVVCEQLLLRKAKKQQEPEQSDYPAWFLPFIASGKLRIVQRALCSSTRQNITTWWSGASGPCSKHFYCFLGNWAPKVSLG